MIDLKPNCVFCAARMLCEIRKYAGYFARDLVSNIRSYTRERDHDELPLFWPDGERVREDGLTSMCCATIAARCVLFTPRKEHNDG